MYESYAWPGAYSFKSEIKIFARWFKNQMDILLRRIEDAEKRVSVGD